MDNSVQTSNLLDQDIELINPDSMFLGGSHATRIITGGEIVDNFVGDIRQVGAQVTV